MISCSNFAYIASVPLSCGPSQVLGLYMIARAVVKSIYHLALKIFYSYRLTSSNLYEIYKEKIKISSQELVKEKIYAVCGVLFLFPVVGISLASYAGYLKKSVYFATHDLFKRYAFLRNKVYELVFPLAQKTIPEYNQIRSKYGHAEYAIKRKSFFSSLESNFKISSVQIPSNGRVLDALWLEQSDLPNTPTVLIHHANLAINVDMEYVVGVFSAIASQKNVPINFLIVTMGGYPQSTPNAPITEFSAYEDAEASAKFAVAKSQISTINKLCIYGLSIGGTLAHYSGSEVFPGALVVADQTLSSLSDIAEKICGVIGKAAMHALFPIGLKKGQMVSDGFNNTAKIRKIGPYCVIKSTQDRLMTGKDGRNLADLNIKKYLEIHAQPCHTITLQGGHCSYLDRNAVVSLGKFLKSNGFF